MQCTENICSNSLFSFLLFIVIHTVSLCIDYNKKYDLNPIYGTLFLKTFGKLIQSILILGLWASGAGSGLGKFFFSLPQSFVFSIWWCHSTFEKGPTSCV